MVKKNVQKTAETDLHNTVVMTAVDIAATMVKSHRAEINQIPGLVDQIVQAFSNSAAVSGIAIPMAEKANDEKSVAQAKPKTPKRKKRDLSGPAHQVMNLAETASTEVLVAAPEVAAPVEAVETTSSETQETAATKRGRGRPRKIKIEAPSPKPHLEHAEKAEAQDEYDQMFIARNPPKCSIEDSLLDTGDGKMTCLVDGKRVSHLKSYLAKTFGLTFPEYMRIYSLPADYPVSPPKFRENKQKFARTIGLGTVEMRQAYKEKMALEDVTTVSAPAEEPPVVVARPSGRPRKTRVVDVAAVTAAA